MKPNAALLIVPTDIEADVVVCSEGLSFWGGVDPNTGTVIDAHHDLLGVCLAGKIVLMPTSRGSCSGSGVLLQLALNDCAPAALVFSEDEEVLTLGALIARQMFDRFVGVLRLPQEKYEDLSKQQSAQIQGKRLISEDLSIDLHQVSQNDLKLTPIEEAMLGGENGKPVALAMEVICAMASAQGAKRLIDVTRGHIDGCIYAHDANRLFAETMADMDAKVAIPTTINAISVDRENYTKHDLPPDFAQAACRLADAYVRMGARPTFTCAPYLASDVPQLGEDIGWSESNAVIFANSVLGARTAKHPDYLDLFIALTGRAPLSGVYLSENRRPQIVIDVTAPEEFDDAFWPLLGWVTGCMAPDRSPLLKGLEHTAPSRDDLRALCAAFGTTSAAPMLHVANVTPEASMEPITDAGHATLTKVDLVVAWHELNTGSRKVDLIALGSPHFSLEETQKFAGLLKGKRRHPGVSVVITLGRDVYSQAQSEGLVDQLRSAGVQFYSDLCWCSIVEPMFPVDAKTLMTNSGKYAHYAPGLSGRNVRFGSLAACAEAATSGSVSPDPPRWIV